MYIAGFRRKEWEGPNGRTGGRQPPGTTRGHEREERAAMETVEDFTNRLRERAKLAGKVYFSWLGHKSIHLGQLICRSKGKIRTTLEEAESFTLRPHATTACPPISPTPHYGIISQEPARRPHRGLPHWLEHHGKSCRRSKAHRRIPPDCWNKRSGRLSSGESISSFFIRWSPL